MSSAKALASVDPELAARVAVQDGPRLDGLPEIMALVAGSSCAWAAVQAEGGQRNPCIEFDGLLGVKGHQDRIIDITLKQFFDEPIPLEAFRYIVEKSYGKPRAFLAPELDPWIDQRSRIHAGFLRYSAAWVWGGGTLDREMIQRLLREPFTTRASIDGASEPVLRINTNMRGNLVHGVSVETWDPGTLQEFRAIASRATDAAIKASEERRGREAADKVKLKLK
jgi:hypothetical protein